MKDFYIKEIQEILESLDVNLKKIENDLPPEGFQEIGALRFDLNMLKDYFEELLK